MSSNTDKILFYGKDILESDGMDIEKQVSQHGSATCFSHSVHVACMSLEIASHIHYNFDEEAIVRGALLHDYYLYDWREGKCSRMNHGFTHAHRALDNAERDFDLNDIERNIICRHMFPLNAIPPRYKESWIVCIADKLCAARECAAAPLTHLHAVHLFP